MTATDIEKAANSIDPAPVSGSGRRFSPNVRLGVPGYSVTSGYLLPKDADARLSGRDRYRLYSENLVNVAIVGTGVRNFLNLVAGANWTMAPKDEDASQAADAAEFMESVIEDMETPFTRVMRRSAMYPFYGFSVQEWTAKSRDDGRIGLADIEPRPQITIERWDVDDRGGVRGVIQRNPNTGADLILPREKLLYVVDDSLSDSPEGLGLFRHMIRPSQGLLRFEDLEHWGFETDLQGIPVGRIPYAALDAAVANDVMTPAERASAIATLEGFIANHVRGPKTGIALDSATYLTTDEKQAPSNQRLWDVELLKSGGTSFQHIDTAIKRKTFELARIMGCEYLLIGADGGGSLALHSSATRRLHGMVNTTLKELADCVDRQIIRPVMMLNNIPKEHWPKATPEKIEYRTVEEVTGALAALATAGAPLLPDDPAINEVRDLVGLSRIDLEDRITQGLMALSAQDPTGRALLSPRPRGQPADALPNTPRNDNKPKASKGAGFPAMDALKAYLESGAVI